ncbi:MAG: HAD family hydrolase [Archaeoglobaceae archaeon]
MRAIKAVIFDLDNTLVDFMSAKIKACEEVSRIANCGSTEELLQYFLRNRCAFESFRSIEEFLREKGVFSPELFSKCCETYEKVKIDNLQIYSGVKEVLGKLKSIGLKLAIVTDAENGKAIARLRKFDLEKFFDAIVSADMCGKTKPEPDSILLALKKLGVEAKDAVIVGDSIYRDISAGKRLGMLTIYARYGDMNPRSSGEADFVAENPRDILEIVETILFREREMSAN